MMPSRPKADRSLIETWLPVARLSAESGKERKAGGSQTLTGLGRWWGRKPLVLVRAVLLGLLLPASDDPKKDMEIFLKLMAMDEEGLWRRKTGKIPANILLEAAAELPPSRRRHFLKKQQSAFWPVAADAAASQRRSRKRFSRDEREELQRLVFARLPYSEKLRYCARPEQIEGPSPEAWDEINAHLGTHARSLPELVQELGERRFGHRPRVGDAFCGGGSVPFEAARLGCDAYGSDLNPVAALLTWAALHIVGGGEEVAAQVQEAQEEVFRAVDAQITEWGIEHNEQGWRADAYLYCTEARCPECGWQVPLAPNWVIAEKYHVVAELVPDEAHRRFEIAIHEGVSKTRLQAAKTAGTVKKSRLHCPHCGVDTPIDMVRRNLRLWENDDLTPRPEDVFQERLYCIRWVETVHEDRRDGTTTFMLSPVEARTLPGFESLLEANDAADESHPSLRHYRAPTPADLAREAKVLALLRERFHKWQARGYLPNRPIEPGDETTRLQRERGWTYWHHLFTPRQLLYHGLLLEQASRMEGRGLGARAALLLGLGRCINANARLAYWNAALGTNVPVFFNQALNTQYVYTALALPALMRAFRLGISSTVLPPVRMHVRPQDGQKVRETCDIWLTDPPYAGAVNYRELSEYFLAWYERHLPHLFAGWYTDSRRSLAVRGEEPAVFRRRMLQIYRNLVRHMPENGLQVVLFTHRDARHWADLSMILWAAGLQATAAWSVATEIDYGLRQGNYVQDTVLLVCRKRPDSTPLFLDELLPRIEQEVHRQLDTMRRLDDAETPDFGDADYQLAAYAAALRVLTAQPIENLEPERELLRLRDSNEENPVETLVRQAFQVACNHLVPAILDTVLWKQLTASERFYLKMLEVESHGEYRNGVYQELARGFGVAEYTTLLADATANQTRLKTPKEFGRRYLGGEGFAGTLTRHVLFALWQAESSEEPRRGLNYLKTELPDYWNQRERITQILDYLAELRRVSGMEHWRTPAENAEILSALVQGDHI